MSLVVKNKDALQGTPSPAVVAKGLNRNMNRDAELYRRRARTLAKQQQAAERVASASAELAAGINEAASAAEELKRAADQISSGAEEAAGAAQESLAAITQVTGALERQLGASREAQAKAEGMRDLAGQINTEISATIQAVGVAADLSDFSFERS